MSETKGTESLTEAPTLGVMRVSITHRCSLMGLHVGTSTGDVLLPIPCDQCYSLAVTSVSIPYRPDVRHIEITTRTTDG